MQEDTTIQMLSELREGCDAVARWCSKAAVAMNATDEQTLLRSITAQHAAMRDELDSTIAECGRVPLTLPFARGSVADLLQRRWIAVAQAAAVKDAGEILKACREGEHSLADLYRKAAGCDALTAEQVALIRKHARDIDRACDQLSNLIRCDGEPT
ncbi:MAG: DUF2383 domain-containing protein [Planctomycetota bacterium]|nr:MAG: DUF2383 domain-containing protein [Planctomycetota bacterium]